jgi:hypothetical protein
MLSSRIISYFRDIYWDCGALLFFLGWKAAWAALAVKTLRQREQD